MADAGPIGFDEYQGHALYAPGLGFYTSGRGAGRRRDFLTSPEVGPLFGAVLARALDAWWEELGRPSPFAVVEAGAGPGMLARTILAARPACRDALDLVLVEVGEVQWASHPDGVTSRVDLPAPGELGDGPVIVLANELLDNLPVALAERIEGAWAEVVVDVEAGDGGLIFAHRPLSDAQQAWCHRFAPHAKDGARIPVQAEAAAWVTDAAALAAGGRVVAFDYARTTAELAALPMEAWLRTYATHDRAGDPLDEPGSCDITCDVAIDQLAAVAKPASVWTQTDFLHAHGLDDLVDEGRGIWEAQGLAGGLEAIAAQSRIREAESLTDPAGLGGFTVLEWAP
ncbi:SAM-dependent methyltransferase [Aquihabitans daechungensis]|uniref:SAM-dependent methyltransferase n=1 Tax=Aquihabitans daechungensis TaxID=1052257 RepID=UPI003BA1A9FB